MENSSSQVADPRWLPRALGDRPEGTALALTVSLAFAIRLYLSLTSYCIAGDGVAYLAMARNFAAGEPAKALASVFSPLYPWLIAIVHHLIPDWELAGSIVSAILGSATVAGIAYPFLKIKRNQWSRHLDSNQPPMKCSKASIFPASAC